MQPLQLAPASSDSVLRPPPGLARGRWEAPAWAFWLVAAGTLLGGLAWIALALRNRHGRGMQPADARRNAR